MSLTVTAPYLNRDELVIEWSTGRKEIISPDSRDEVFREPCVDPFMHPDEIAEWAWSLVSEVKMPKRARTEVAKKLGVENSP